MSTKSGNKTQKAISAMKEEPLTDDEAIGLISAIVQRTRNHPDIVRGASVRGALAFRQVLQGFEHLGNGQTRNSIEKAAMITLPSRIATRQGNSASAGEIIGDIVREILYGTGVSGKKHGSRRNKDRQKLSLEDFMAALQNLSLSKTLRDRDIDYDEDSGRIEIIAENEDYKRLNRKNMPKDPHFKNKKDWYPSLEKALKELIGELEKKLVDGEISGGDYRYQKKKLEDMLKAASYLQTGASEKELAETVMEFMDARDKQWQKELEFQDIYVYYHLKETQDEGGLSYPKRNWYALKVVIDFLESQDIVKSDEEGTAFTLTARAMDIVLRRLMTRQAGNGRSGNATRRFRRTASERSQDTRRYVTGDVFRDISIRRTLREIARRRQKLSEINRSALRIFIKENRKQKSDIMLCVDSSGSMGFHQKLILARLTAAAIARTALQNGDRVGVVTFDDLGRAVISPTDREEIVFNYIAGITAGGNTNIGDGLRCARQLLLNEPGHNRKRIMLITDGEPTAISEKVLALMEQSRERDLTGEYAIFETRRAALAGIETSVLHITDGKTTGRRLVSAIARTGHGNIQKISRPEDLKAVIRK